MIRDVGLKTILSFLLALMIVVGVTGCGRNRGGEDDQTLVRVGYFPNMTHAQALVGFNDGSFREALGDNVVVEDHKFNAGPALIEALLAGEIDLGYIGPVPAVNGFVKSKGKLHIIAGSSVGGAVLLASSSGIIKSVKDLDGKRVAVPQLGNTQDILLRKLLAEVGLKDASKGGTVTIIPADNSAILTLISRGEVDAALVPEPWGSIIVANTGANILLKSDDIWPEGNLATSVLIVSAEFLEMNSDLVEKWLEVHIRLTENINGDKERSKAQINEQLKKLTGRSLPEDVLDKSFSEVIFTIDPVVPSIEEFANISFRAGYLKEKPDIENLFNFELINKILKQQGKSQLSIK